MITPEHQRQIDLDIKRFRLDKAIKGAINMIIIANIFGAVLTLIWMVSKGWDMKAFW